MKTYTRTLRFEVELSPDETLEIPAELAACVRGGSWVVTVEPLRTPESELFRYHSSFPASYSAEDEGLYDDVPAR